VATLLRHFRGTSHNGAEPVEKGIPPRTDTNTGTVTGVHHGPDRQGSFSQDQQTASGPTDQEEKETTEDDLAQDNMTSITSFQVSPDLMEQTPFHSYALHEDKFDPAAFATNSNNYEFPTFPDAPPLAGNPLFDEKEAAFMSSFFDTVDQNTSFDHEFHDGLAQWTVPGLDIRKGFEDVWNNQPNVPNGTSTNTSTTNNNYSANSVFSMPQYEQASPSEPTYAATPYPKNQNVAILHTQPQQYNPSPQNFLSHLHNPNHNPNDLARTVFTHRNSHPTPSQCDPLFSSYPSLNIPVASPSALPPSAAQTPNSTPKLHNYGFLKQHEISSSESPPAISAIPPRLSNPHVPPSTYAPSTASSVSPQPSGKPPRKKRRENLSEHQKRLNHITSEQKRRNLIQEGFNEIHSLVPTLRGQRERGDSKSTVLLKTVDYIQELREGNERLRRMLKR
jgi:hypothetical protein